jgi:hypothetical protein
MNKLNIGAKVPQNLFVFVLILSMLVTVFACSSGSETTAAATTPGSASSTSNPTVLTTVNTTSSLPTTSVPSATTTVTKPVTTTPPPTTGVTTVMELSDVGAGIFSIYCTNCHGSSGGGASAPAVIGPTSNLPKFGTAKVLRDYIKQNMPRDNAGSLSPLSYNQLAAFLMLQNNYLLPAAIWDESKLSGIILK